MELDVTDACAQIERAERLHRQFFHPARPREELWIMVALPGVEQ
jgi:hypothetical protein